MIFLQKVNYEYEFVFSSKAVITKKIVIKNKVTYIFFLPLLYVALN